MVKLLSLSLLVPIAPHSRPHDPLYLESSSYAHQSSSPPLENPPPHLRLAAQPRDLLPRLPQLRPQRRRDPPLRLQSLPELLLARERHVTALSMPRPQAPTRSRPQKRLRRGVRPPFSRSFRAQTGLVGRHLRAHQPASSQTPKRNGAEGLMACWILMFTAEKSWSVARFAWYMSTAPSSSCAHS